jgi:ADP-heptose:LPS heptosyltransferase
MSGPRVLVLRFTAIGDCIMAAWPTTAIRMAHPDARITWAIQPRCAPVVAIPDLVDELALFDREGWKWRVWSLQRWREQLGFYFGLRRQGLDVGFDLQGHAKTALALWIANPKQKWSVGGTDPLARKMTPLADLTGATHEVERGMAVVRMWQDLPLPERPMMPLLDLPSSSQPLITIQTGAGGPRKSYPLDHWTQVAKLLADTGARLVSIGGPGDPAVPGTEALNGKLDLRQSLAYVAASQVHLAADTGTGHAAAAYGVPVVSIFGPMDPNRYRPWTTRSRVLRCGMNPADVKPEAVAAAALELLEAAHPVSR